MSISATPDPVFTFTYPTTLEKNAFLSKWVDFVSNSVTIPMKHDAAILVTAGQLRKMGVAVSKSAPDPFVIPKTAVKITTTSGIPRANNHPGFKITARFDEPFKPA